MGRERRWELPPSEEGTECPRELRLLQLCQGPATGWSLKEGPRALRWRVYDVST